MCSNSLIDGLSLYSSYGKSTETSVEGVSI